MDISEKIKHAATSIIEIKIDVNSKTIKTVVYMKQIIFYINKELKCHYTDFLEIYFCLNNEKCIKKCYEKKKKT